jgi:hypothetical protein
MKSRRLKLTENIHDRNTIEAAPSLDKNRSTPNNNFGFSDNEKIDSWFFDEKINIQTIIGDVLILNVFTDYSIY